MDLAECFSTLALDFFFAAAAVPILDVQNIEDFIRRTLSKDVVANLSAHA